MIKPTADITFVDRSQIDRQKWDACIRDAANSIIYAQSWYLDLVADRWGALIEGDYHRVMPLPYSKKYGLTYIYQPFFVQQLGIFGNGIDVEKTRSFLHAVPRKFSWIDLNLNTFNPAVDDTNIRFQKRLTYELDLRLSYNRLRAGYSENTIRNIRKAEKAGVFISEQGSPDELIEGFRQFRGKQLGVFDEKQYRMLRRLISEGTQRGMSSLLHAYGPENNFCAGIVFIRDQHKTVFLFSAATPEARQNGAMFMLVDYFIRKNAGEELMLDFEGSSQAGLARFYSGFGSKECVFLRMQINRLPVLLKPLANFYHCWKKRKKRET